jgi:integrase/recombinase XerD
MFNDFYAYLQITHAKGTVCTYTTTLRAYQAFLGARAVPPWEAKEKEIVAFLATRAYLSVYARRREISCLRGLYEWAVDNELLIKNPVARIKRPKIPPMRKAFLTETELAALFTAVETHGDTYETLVFALFRYTGQRQSEVLPIKWKDINLANGTALINQRKTYQTRVIPLHGKVLALLKVAYAERQPQPEHYVICGRQVTWGRAYLLPEFSARPQTIQAMLKKRAKQAGIDKKVTLHTFRHSMVTNARIRGISPEAIQQAIGHASLRTTLEYDQWLGNDSTATTFNEMFDDKGDS